ncbi:hypothetical protein NKH77_08600 [Streptomyces sp. M19]
MATGMWQETRDAVVGLFRRSGRERRAALEAQLDANAALVRAPRSRRRCGARCSPTGTWSLRRCCGTTRWPGRRRPPGRLRRHRPRPGRMSGPTQTNAAKDSATLNAVQYGTQYAYGPGHRAPAPEDGEQRG